MSESIYSKEIRSFVQCTVLRIMKEKNIFEQIGWQPGTNRLFKINIFHHYYSHYNEYKAFVTSIYLKNNNSEYSNIDVFMHLRDYRLNIHLIPAHTDVFGDSKWLSLKDYNEYRSHYTFGWNYLLDSDRKYLYHE